MKNWERYYEEYYCRVMVEKFLPQYNFEKSERPDWIDKRNNIGMECTIAQVNDEYKTALMYSEYINGKCRNPEKRLDDLNKKGEVTKWFFVHEATDGNALPSLQMELRKKLVKLNENTYQRFNENWLAFYLENPIEEWHIKQYQQGLKNTQQEFQVKFNKILICGNCLADMDMNSDVFKLYKLKSQGDFAEQVKDIAIQEEGN